MTTRPALIVHGGAWAIPEVERDLCLDGCRNAARAGWAVLQKGGSALDAVEAAVHVLEDDPIFDAGIGSCLNADGDIEMDAIIMDGATLNVGAVAALRRTRYPITVARLLMEHTQHNFLVGAGAEAFARAHGIPEYPQDNLITELERERWQKAKEVKKEIRRDFSHDTVGAVALDANGHLAVATSTGGTANKLPGRVGDSPLIGSGAYADDGSGAASATGWGESLMKIVISKTACDLIATGCNAQQAAEAAIKRLAERVNGLGGIIVLDHRGNVGCAYNTPRMARAWVTPEGEIAADF
jgi:beta-aspartyl-peptidase (threonine type)